MTFIKHKLKLSDRIEKVESLEPQDCTLYVSYFATHLPNEYNNYQNFVCVHSKCRKILHIKYW